MGIVFHGNVIVGICMDSIVSVSCLMPKCNGPAIITIFCDNPIAACFGGNVNPLNSIRGPDKYCVVRLLGVGFPLSAVCAAHSLVRWENMASLYYNITAAGRKQAPRSIFDIRGRRAARFLIFPRGKLVVNINDVSVHLREWLMITDDLFGLDLPQQFLISFLHTWKSIKYKMGKRGFPIGKTSLFTAIQSKSSKSNHRPRWR